MSRRLCILILILIPLLLLPGCGYRNPYFQGDSDSPSSQKLHIPLWMNRTNELGLETTFKHVLNRWFRQSSKVRTTSIRKNADLILDGEILTISLPGAAFQEYNRAQEVSATLTIRYTLRNGHDNSIIWQEGSRTRSEIYRLEPDPTVSLGNREQALNTLANELSERIYQRTMDTISRM